MKVLIISPLSDSNEGVCVEVANETGKGGNLERIEGRIISYDRLISYVSHLMEEIKNEENEV